jgi:molecular chaperone HtpG
VSEAIPVTTHAFRAEVAAVLRLVTNSLYTNRDIFLRELVSNASDALDKARFAALVDPELQDRDAAPQIRIEIDAAAGTLVIEDNGIGMSAAEAEQNLGTIAHSGTLEFLQRATERGAGGKPDLDLIGQFGVGFYSAFMVAETIDVDTRSATVGHAAVRWSSKGDGSFTLGPSDRAHRGTRITLHLREDAKDYLDRWRLQGIIKRYSDYVLHPIVIVSDEGGSRTGEDQQVNSAKAFWTRAAKDLSDADYQEFYTHVMGGFVLPGDTPLARLHVGMDAPIQFKSVLFVPGHRPMDLFGEDSKHLRLYARRVLVMESCDKLLPPYLRFFRGVVDSEDLPLNVSREMLQEHSALAAIRRQLTRKALALLADTAKDDAATYAKLWREFGVFVKEGLHTDNAHREQLTELLRFDSTRAFSESADATGGLISLQQYIDAMSADQGAIYYISGESAAALAKSPHLEACRAKGFEVLLMTDAVDEWVVQDLEHYKDKPLVNVTKGDFDVAPASEPVDEGTLAPLFARAKTVLGERVKDVRASRRLRESAACLVDDDAALGRNMERILRMAGREITARPRILELNPEHAFVRATAARLSEQSDDAQASLWIQLLFDQASIAEGTVPDPAGMVQRIQQVLDRVAGLGAGERT